MAITNLTGTKWLLNETFNKMPNNENFYSGWGAGCSFTINFISNFNNYTYIVFQDDDYFNWGINYGSTLVWSDTWVNNNYRTIEFNGEVTDASGSMTSSNLITWLQANATQIIEPSGYTITFNSNGGTTFSDIEEATELPTLPIPTKSGYTFVAWYYESDFQTRANAGDTIESNVTLYAKWHNLGSLFTEIANAIREKESSSETIRDVDFGERIKQIQGAIELTQAQYDALETKDANTYYLIVEVE